MAGINRGSSYRRQPPWETRDALNVRGYGTLEGAARGGQRGGLERVLPENLGGPIHMLAQVTRIAAEGESVNTYWYDEFTGVTDRWTAYSWIGAMMPTKKSLSGTFLQSDDQVGGVYENVDIDAGEDYSMTLNIVPFKGRHWGTYKAYCRMNDTTPDATADGITAVLTFDSDGAVGGQLESRVAGSLTTYAYDLSSVNLTLFEDDVLDQLGNNIVDIDDNDVVVNVRADNTNAQFKVVVSDNTIQVYWRGVNLITQVVPAPSGELMGMAMQAPGPYPDSLCLTDRWTIAGYTSGLNERVRRTHLVASEGGDLWVERIIGSITEEFTDVLTDGVPLQAAERAQILYIANHGASLHTTATGALATTALTDSEVADFSSYGISPTTHIAELFAVSGTVVAGTYGIASVATGTINLVGSTGTGDCSFRIIPSVKQYNPETNALTMLTATAGQVPANCDLICVYRDRLVLAIDHLWYMSRAGNPQDWDYSPDTLDAQRAVAGLSADAGQIGESVTALIPFSDDYLIFGCANSLWVLRGDPAAGGRIDNLSYEVGILSGNAWCHGSLGEVYFLSRDGIYMLEPGPMVAPQPLSRDKLPRELRELDPMHSRISMTWDPEERTVMIHATPGIYWAYSTRNGAFWEDSLNTDHQPYSSLNFKTEVRGAAGAIYGCEDGYIRTLSPDCQTDDGYSIQSHVDYGPFRIAHDLNEGLMKVIEGTLAHASGPVLWGIKAGFGSEDAQRSEIIADGEWSGDGLQFTDRPRVRGGSAILRLSSEGVLSWVVEKVMGIIGPAGRNRRRS